MSVYGWSRGSSRKNFTSVRRDFSYCLTCHGELKVEFVNVARETFVKKELRTNKLDTLKQRKNFQKGVVLKIEIFIPSDLL